MKRVKPGRAPSAMGAAMSVVVAVFGVFWTIAALSIGVPVFSYCLVWFLWLWS